MFSACSFRCGPSPRMLIASAVVVIAIIAQEVSVNQSKECDVAPKEADAVSGAPLDSPEELELQAAHCFSLFGFHYVVVTIDLHRKEHIDHLQTHGPISIGLCAPIRCSGWALNNHLRSRLPQLADLDVQTPIKVMPLLEVLLKPHVHACENDGSPSWMHSKEHCVLGACDFFSAGGGEECVVTADGIGSNSCTFSQRTLDLLHCPLSVPLALLIVPKAASSSAVEWISHLDGGHHARIQNLLTDEQAPELNTWYPDRLFIRFFKELKQYQNCKYDDILLHFKRVIDMSHHDAFYLRGPYCLTCCRHGTGRLRALLVRNPFSRVAALFRSHGTHVAHSFIDFANLVADGVRNGFNAFSASTSHMFATHATSVVSLLRKGSMTPGSFLVLHLETLSSDIQHLANRLCEDFSYCEPLPNFPVLNVEASRRSAALHGLPDHSEMSAASMTWPQDVAANILDSFWEDFEAFGYSKDPTILAPLSGGEEMFFDWPR